MKFIPNAVTFKVARTALVLQKNSPNILFGAGVVGVVATAVLASKATLQVEGVLDQHDKQLQMIEEGKLAVDTHGVKVYSEEDARKDTMIVWGKTTHELIKLYGPTVICGIVTIAALSKSHNMLNERNAGLAAAYAIVD